MHKILFIGLLIGCFHFASFAQDRSTDPQGFKQRLRNTYLQNDTAQAIINLYSRRQAGGTGWMVSGALAAVRIATASNTTTSNSSYSVKSEGPSVGAVFLVTAPILSYGLSKMLRFSNGHLEKTLAAYAAGQPLPRSLRRKLKPRFFSQPIIDYRAVPMKAAS